MMSVDTFGRFKTEVEGRTIYTWYKGKASAEKQGDIGETPGDARGVKRRDRKKVTCLHGPVDSAQTLKLRFRAGDLDLP